MIIELSTFDRPKALSLCIAASAAMLPPLAMADIVSHSENTQTATLQLNQRKANQRADGVSLQLKFVRTNYAIGNSEAQDLLNTQLQLHKIDDKLQSNHILRSLVLKSCTPTDRGITCVANPPLIWLAPI